ncbi:ankyrin repeat and KH domain-containing protein 1 [Biomphalaria glabrata]|nr:ankyrin repeat and KH domain-containing protein 1 [Biomphalaria glabrata]
MAETSDKVELDDSILFRTKASGCSSEIFNLLTLCDFSDKALNWGVHQACNIGHAHLLQLLLQDGTRLELRDDNGNTPLILCSAKGFPGIVGQLLSMGADVNAKNNHGDTALMLATSVEVIHCLLEDRRLHIDDQNQTGNTALMLAIDKSHFQKVKLLINAGANPNREASQSGLTSRHGQLVNNSNESAFDMAKRMGVGKLLDLLYRAKLFNSNPLHLAAEENDFETCITLLQYNLIDKDETLNLRPDILCYILRKIQQREAILTTDVEFVKKLCMLGMDVNICQCCTKSRVELVLDKGSYELAEILCAHGAQVTHDDLVSAVKGQHVQMIPLLVKYGAPINKYEPPGCLAYRGSALDMALENSFVAAASILLSLGAKLDAQGAVTQALRKNNVQSLNFLVTECAEMTKSVIRQPQTFIQAVKSGNIQNIQMLLDAGLDINRVHINDTPIMSAARVEVVDFLLSKGADVNFKTTTTPLINALSYNCYDEIKSIFHYQLNTRELEEKMILLLDSFLKNGACLHDSDTYGNTALMKAVTLSNTESVVLKYLLDKGAEVNRRNNDGFTALHVAAESNNVSCSKLLLEYGAIVNLKCQAGLTPLHQAVGNVNLVKLFLENHANVNAEDERGNTPLLLASKYFGDVEDVVKLLITHGSNVNHRNKWGMYPLWQATKIHNTKCLTLLLGAKADLGHDHKLCKSALSVLLNKWFPNEQTQRTAALLLEHAASAEFVRADIIHRLIAAGNDGILAQQLIKSGICPTDIVLKRTIFGWPETSVSPLAVSLMLDSLDFVRYFIENWYLTKSDIKLLSRNEDVLNYLEQHEARALPYLKEVSRQPMRLELLCFITVSSVLGSDESRRQKIRESKLPALLQDQLLFTKLEHKVLQALNVDNGFIFLHHLTKSLADQEEESDFYDMDEDFPGMNSSSESTPNSLNNSDMGDLELI